jgi:hypothetical protein
MIAPVLALAAVFVCWPVCDPSPAQAAFAPFELASSDPELGIQAEYAYEPAISPEGRYVAFIGVVAGKHGIYRKDLITGELATVAEGVSAGAPSISGEGRYVSFTSSEPVPGVQDSGGPCTQVYRADLQEPLKPTYTIVSARSGSEEPLAYETCSGGGSASANRVAISEDGSEVAFTIIGRSNLIGEEGRTETPENQIAVRNLGANPPSTTLVSVEKDTPNPVEGGAALSGPPRITPEEGSRPARSEDSVSTAAISANGAVVAWMGMNVFAQTELSVRPAGEKLEREHANVYAEPLWRDVTEGPAAPTRRVLAGDDSSAPGCPPACAGGLDLTWDEQAEIGRWPEYAARGQAGPREGSFVEWALRGVGSDLQALTPQLSADGMEVAILSTQPDYGHIPDFGQFQTELPAPTTNAFVVNMAPGLTREQAITRLTEWASPELSSGALDGKIDQIAMSADGTRVLFITDRNVFPLAPPALITERVSQEIPQLYEADLQAGTLALVSQGYNGEPADAEGSVGGAAGTALSASGEVLALASGSSNLAPGTVNEGSAVFVTREQVSPEAIGEQSVTALPPGPPGEPAWSISATASRSRDGALLIDVSVPGAGRLATSASARVPITVAVSRSKLRSTPARRGRAAAARARTTTVIASRQVASAAATATGEGLVALRLLPVKRYRSLVSSRGGLYATISVTFAAPGHRKLTETLQASFPRPAPVHHPAKPRT